LATATTKALGFPQRETRNVAREGLGAFAMLQMRTIRLLIADKNPLVRARRTLAESHPDIEVVGEAAAGRELLSKASALNPERAEAHHGYTAFSLSCCPDGQSGMRCWQFLVRS